MERFNKDFFREKYLNDPETFKEIAKEINHRYYLKNKKSHAKSVVKWFENNPAKRLFYSCRSYAKRNGTAFNIEMSDIVVPEYCPIMGVRINPKLGMGRLKNGPSIDKIDPIKGYTKGNVQVISLLANRMKSNATIDELVDFAKGILRLYDPRSLSVKEQPLSVEFVKA